MKKVRNEKDVILNKEIGGRMRKLRKVLGYTQEKMVSFFPVKRSDCSRIEKGEIYPNPIILNALRKEFDVSLDWLIADTGKMFVRKTVKKEPGETIDFGEYTEEVRELLIYMSRVPMVKHAILGFFLEYKSKYKDIIQQTLLEIESEDAYVNAQSVGE